MKNSKRVIAGAMALLSAVSVASCGSSSGGDSSSSYVDKVKVASTDDIATIPDGSEKELEWLSYFDINPTKKEPEKRTDLTLFEEKGGKIKYSQTSSMNKYDKLAARLMSNNPPDMFWYEQSMTFPANCIKEMFQPVDDYIDLNAPLWQDVSEAMEIYNFNGKHYEIVNSVSAEAVVIYNKQTISEQGLDDPWELYQAGEWNWDTFEKMLEQYCDPDADQWGLDGFWAEKALFLSAGVPSVQSVDGRLKTNLNDATVEKAMNFGYDLYNKGLVMDRSLFDWNEQPQFMGEGKELFYIIGAWGVQSNPDTWNTKIPVENLGLAPVPSPEGSDPYQAATLDGWVICKGAANPEGVALFADCTRLANTNDEAIAIADQKMKDDYQWTEELIAINKEINDLARQYPVVDLATGVSTDVASLTTDGGSQIGLRAAFHGVEWATNREEISDVVDMLVQEVDDQLAALA